MSANSQLMKIGAVIPDRNDRPRFLAQCMKYIERQTVKIDVVELVNYKQVIFPLDLTQRYKDGLNSIKDKCDVIFCIENDDWYAPDYVETMLRLWEQMARPELFGIGETYFYHFPSQSYWHREHAERACAYSTMITAEAVGKVDFRNMSTLLFDMGVWRQKELSKMTCRIAPPITIGMKHGFGVCGAAGHNAWFYQHEPNALKDHNYKWLTQQIGEEDTEFYREMAKDRKA